MGDYTLEQALALASENAGNTLNDAIHVNIDTREITVPQSQQLFGVESDADVEIKHIVIDGRYADGNRDLSKLAWRVIYRNANKETSYYLIPSVVANENSIEMDWLIKRSVVAYKGTVDFILCAFATTSSGEVTPEWNSTLGQGIVLEGLETSAIDIGKESVDELAKILYETIVARDAAATSAADADSTANSIKDSMAQISENKKAVNKLKSDLAYILESSENMLNPKNILKETYATEHGIQTSPSYANWFITEKIKVVGGNVLQCNTPVNSIVIYNADGTSDKINSVSKLYNTVDFPFTLPVTADSVILAFRMTYVESEIMVNMGSEPLPYKPYGYIEFNKNLIDLKENPVNAKLNNANTTSDFLSDFKQSLAKM